MQPGSSTCLAVCFFTKGLPAFPVLSFCVIIAWTFFITQRDTDMAGYNQNSSIKELIIAIPGAIVGFTLLVSLLAYLFGVVGGEKAEPSKEATEAADQKVVELIKPVATVEVAEAAGAHVEKSGEEIVKGVCIACHGVGALGAPKIGNAGDWGPRIAQGYETLVKHAIEGIRSMPARGGNAELSDHEVADAVAYMANQAGAKFDAASLKK
jgi:cytochrome c5